MNSVANVTKLLSLLAAMALATAGAHDIALSREYAKLERGAFDASAFGRFGQHAHIATGGEAWWIQQGRAGETYEKCARTFRYTPLLNFFDDAYQVCLDERGRVIGKYHLTSR